MATVQVIREGRFVIFGLPKEGGGSERLVASVMHGAIRGQALFALRSLEVPSFRQRLTKTVAFDVPNRYCVAGEFLPNTKENRRYLRLTVAGRQPLWLRFSRPVDMGLVKLLQSIQTKPLPPTPEGPRGAALRFKFGQTPLSEFKKRKRRKASGKKETA